MQIRCFSQLSQSTWNIFCNFATMKIKQHIPNLLTLMNLLSGSLAVYLVSQLDTKNLMLLDLPMITIFAALISFSLVCDLLDGMVARWLNVASPLGLQLDSLADMVTFGVFPGILMVKMFENALGPESMLLAALGFGITLFSALRLAKFNVDLTQTSYFKGLATPANTILIFGIYILYQNHPEIFFSNGFNILLATTVISCYLLIANLPLFSFKLKSMAFKDIIPQILLLISAVILLIILKFNALALIIVIYILISIIFRKKFVHA